MFASQYIFTLFLCKDLKNKSEKSNFPLSFLLFYVFYDIFGDIFLYAGEPVYS